MISLSNAIMHISTLTMNLLSLIIISCTVLTTIVILTVASESIDIDRLKNEFWCKSDLCFYFNGRKVKWSEAQEDCIEKYGYILDDSVPKDLWSEFYSLNGNMSEIWLGAKKNDRYFQWVGRKPALLKFPRSLAWEWMDNEPNLVNGGSCIIIGSFNNESTTMLLKTHSCSLKQQYVCVTERRNLEFIGTGKPNSSIPELQVTLSAKLDSNLLQVETNHITLPPKTFDLLSLHCNIATTIKPDNNTIIQQSIHVRWLKDGYYLPNEESTLQPTTVYDLTRINSPPGSCYGRQGVYACIISIDGHPKQYESNNILVDLDNTLNFIVTTVETPLLKDVHSISDGESFPYELMNEMKESGLNLDNVTSQWDQLQPTYSEYPGKRVYIERFYYFYVNITTKIPMNDLLLWRSTKNNNMEIHFPTVCREDSIISNNKNLTFPTSLVGVLSSPSNGICVTSNKTVVTRMCQWGVLDGRWLVFTKPQTCLYFREIEKLNICASDEIKVAEYCVQITESSSWEDASNLCTKMSANVTQNIFLFENVTLSVFPEYLWLPWRRLWPAGPNIDMEESNFSLDNNSLTMRNVSWSENEPVRDKNCLLFNTRSRKLLMTDCNKEFPTMCIKPIVDETTLPDDHCSHGFISGNINRCFKIISGKVHRFDEAKETCHDMNSKLVSVKNINEQKSVELFMLKLNVTTPVWIDLIQTNLSLYSDGRVLDPLSFKFSQNVDWRWNYGVLEESSVNFYGNFRKFAVLCEKTFDDMKSGSLILEKPKRNSENFEIQSPSELDTNQTRCFCNGKEVNKFLETGYYQCHTFRSSTKSYLKSNIVTYKNPSEMIFIVKFQDSARPYNPLIHDSTFISSDTDYEHQINELITAIQTNTLIENIHISKVNISKDEMSGYLNINFQLHISKADISDEEYIHVVLREFLVQNYNYKSNNSLSVIAVLSTLRCQADKIIVSTPMRSFEKLRRFTWPGTRAGMCAVTSPPCRNLEGKPEVRCCVQDFIEGAYWEKSHITCQGNVNSSTLRLWELSTNNSINDIANALKNHSMPLNYDEIFYLTNSLEKTQDNSTQGLRSVVSIVNNVMQTDRETLKTSQTFFNSSNRILTTIENITMETVLTHNGETVNKDNFAAQVWDLNTASIVGFTSQQSDGITTINTLYSGESKVKQSSDAALILPEKFVKNGAIERTNKNSSLRLSFVVYKNEKLFQPLTDDRIVNSVIVQASTKDVAVYNINPPVKLYFKPLRKQRNNETTCVFWDFHANDNNGGWSTDGCSYAGYQDNHDVCLCNHLTSFAVLVSYREQDDMFQFDEIHVRVLDIISLIGCLLSLFGQLLVFVTFVLFKQWRKPLGNKIVVNLCFALSAVYILFLVGLRETEYRPICLFTAIALHYFLLAAFFWMLVEAFHQYLRFVKVLGTYIPRFMMKASIVAWGLPAFPVIIVLGYDYNMYFGGEHFCWMALECFYYTFLAPLVTILFVNAIIYALIIYNIYFRKQLRSNQSKTNLAMSQFRMAISVFILLGLTWVFGTLAISDAELVFSYLFCIFSTLQGFFIFVFHILHEKTSMNLWKAFLSVCERYDSRSIYSEPTSPITSQISSQEPFQQEKGRYIPVIPRQSILVMQKKENI